MIKDNTIILLFAEAGLLVLAVVGLLTGTEPLAYTAAGAFVGVVSGHLNGTAATPTSTTPLG